MARQRHCLHGELDVEEVEDALLECGRPGEDSGRGRIAEADDIAGERCEVGEERSEAVDRLTVGGAIAVGLGLGRGRDRGGRGRVRREIRNTQRQEKFPRAPVAKKKPRLRG